MNLNALMSTLLSEESIDGVCRKTGANAEQVRGVLGSALPLLLNGAGTQANNAETASGFAGALQQHAQNDTSSLSSFLNGVDLEDGGKIVAHLLGINTAAQTQAVAQQSGVSTAQTSSILSAAAPLLMSLLGQQSNAQSGNASNVAGLMGSLLGSGDMNSLLGSLLGSGTAQQTGAVQQINSASQKTGLLGKLLGLLK